jgi:hypothetical protein
VIGGKMDFLIFYGISILVSFWSLQAGFSTSCENFLPRWSVLRETITGGSFVCAFIVTLLPIFNLIALGVCLLGWLVDSKTVAAYFRSHPFSKYNKGQ